MSKIVILGAGFVGTAAATYLCERNIADIVMIDVVNGGLAAGKALDLNAGAAVRGYSTRIYGTDKIEDAKDADVVINTAGMPRKPGMDRMDLLKINVGIASKLARGVAEHAPGAVIINVSNPLDVICYSIFKASGFPRERVVGMAGVLDSTRFRTFLAREIDCDPRDVSAMVLGGHGDQMVPIIRTATVTGVPITELLAQDKIDAIVERTRNAGAEVVKLLQTGSAFSSVGASITQMAECCLVGTQRVLPGSAYLEGEYGLEGMCLGVPLMLGQGGIQKIIELQLTDDERAALQVSADATLKGIKSVESEIG